MLFRSRFLFVLILIPFMAVAVTGCKKTKPKPEMRLAGQSSLAGKGGAGSTFGPGSGWGADGGAPGVADFSLGGGNALAGGAGGFGSAAKGATGDYLNDAWTAGISDGNFISELEMIHFEYDRAEIPSAWAGVLDQHAEWIKANPNVMVQIEGHCDERGTEEYNISLGQRRADIVRSYLIERGIDGHRLSTLSYGKMRPLSFDQSEEALALNRRAMFLVYEVNNQAGGTANATTY